MTYDYEIALKLILACILGGIVGWQREKINKPAGIRTHMLVALGSALVTVISVYAFKSFDTVNQDPGRIMSNIVTGIGFLGAGTIIHEGPTVKGLTTAASIWVVAAIGMAAGSGMYISALVTTFLVFLILDGFWEKIIYRHHRVLRLKISNEFKLKEIGTIIENNGIVIKHVSILPIKNSKDIPVAFKLSASDKTDMKQVILEIGSLEGVTITHYQDASSKEKEDYYRE
ncbi:MgtC/SapB family protein [Desulfitobacterium metallireducens]|nr:MgtC/SapB family protein [Desulfitobacterium metallireducens]